MRTYKPILLLTLGMTIIIVITFRNWHNEDVSKSLGEEEITLGVMAPLTGDFANYGQMISRGVEIAVEKAKLPHLKVNVEYQDACLPKEAIPAVKRLLAKDIDVLVGNYCILGLKATASEFVKRKIPVFQTAELTESITNLGPNILSINIQAGKEAEAVAEHAVKDLNARTASIIRWPGDWGEEHAKYFSERFKNLGGNILNEIEVDPLQTDFKTEVLRINGKKPDVVYAVLVARGLGEFIKQLRYAGGKTQLLTTSEGEEVSVIETAKGMAEGMQFLVPEKGASQESNKFIENYQQTYHEFPNILTRIAYDSTIIAIEALSLCKKEYDCFLKEIYKKRNIQGVSGEFSIISNKGSEKGFVLKYVKDGVFVKGEPDTPRPDF